MKMHYVLFSDGHSIICSDISEIDENTIAATFVLEDYDSDYIYEFNGKTLDKIKRPELIEKEKVPKSLQQIINTV